MHLIRLGDHLDGIDQRNLEYIFRLLLIVDLGDRSEVMSELPVFTNHPVNCAHTLNDSPVGLVLGQGNSLSCGK